LKYFFQIADIKFVIITNFVVKWHPIIIKFLVDNDKDFNYSYHIYTCDELPNLYGQLMYEAANQKIYKNGNLESRVYFLPLYHYPMMIYQELDDIHRNIYVLNDYVENICRPKSFSIFNALSAEKMFIKYDSFILHSSFIIYNNYAILFTAPSGTGKSTQAYLWAKYKDAKIINEDRTLIKKEKNVWYGYGIPISGSSNICMNERAPIKAVIYLSQYEENIIKKLSISVAIKRLISETTINFWNTDFLNHVISLIEDFSCSIPIYHLSCKKDEDSVNTLFKILEENI